MRKFFSLLMIIMTAVMVNATSITMPATTLDLQNPSMVEDADWYGETAYYLDNDVLVVSGYESYKSVASQTWITYASTGSSSNTWDALAPFKGSDYYTNKNYATLQAGRYTAYLLTGCDSVWVYGYNNAVSKYLVMNIYEITETPEAIDDAEVTATYSVNNSAVGKANGVMKQALDATKKYLVVTSAVGSSNSRVFEVAFFRHPSAAEADYYLIGTMSGWQVDEANKLTASESEEGQYEIIKTLAANDAFKVVKAEGENLTWYPDGQNNDYVITTAGDYKVYFRPDGQGGEGWHYGCIKAVLQGGGDPQPIAHTYTVAGNSADLFGTTWDPTNVANDMALQEDGTYKWEKEGLALPAGHVEFKVCEDHAWTVAYPASNFVLTIGETGTYTIAIIYNPESHVIVADADKTGSAEVDPTAAIKGGWDNWTEETAFQLAENKLSASATLHLTVADYSFKMILNGGDWRSNGYTYRRDYTGCVGITGNTEADMVLQADVEGDYTITWTFANDSINIAFPEAPAEPQLPTIAIAGTMNDWSSVANIMTVAEDSLTASVTIALDANNYDFKVVVGGHWLGKDATYDITRENPAAEAVNQEISYGPNLVLHADVLGDYTFTWTYADNSLVVTFPEAPVVETPKFYITGNAALVGQDKEWNPAAIPSMEDSKVLALEAGSYMMKITTNGAWEGENNVKGYDALTGEIPAGVTRGENENNDNICFTLAEAGDVTVTYTAESFTIAGNFYVAPVAKYYLIGDSAFVVDAGATADKAWTPAAIPCMENITELNLKGGVDYIMRLSLNGTWENHRDFRHLTDTAAGLIELTDEYENHSIGFRLIEDGLVIVTYIPATEEQPEVFTLAGNFYVAPEQDPTVAVMGSMNDWAAEIPFVLSDDKSYASLTVNHISADEYEFKFLINGDWRSNGHRYHRGYTGAAGITENNDANMVFVADVDGQYTFYWYFANDSAAIVYPALPFVCDWENIAWVAGSNDQIKVCHESDDVEVVSVQNPHWSAMTEDGIYMTFPSAAWGTISLPKGSYEIQGAGILVYLSALTEEYNEISIVCQDVEYIINVYNAAAAPQPAQPEYFLIGTFNGWTAADEYKFAVNPNNEAEWMLQATLAENDAMKVLRVKEGEDNVWFPDGMDNDYVVDAAHAGETTIYFRPDGQGGEGWYYGYIYVAENTPQGCDWEHIDFLASAVPQYANQFKVCKEGEQPNVVNIQESFGTEAGIYVTFPSAAFGEISLPEGSYATQGAGMILYCSAFETQQETEVTVVCDGNPIVFTIYNANYTPAPPTGNLRFVPGVWNIDGAKFAAVTWKVGEAFENGQVSAWFEYLNADTLVGNIPNDADSIAFARFNSAAEVPSMDMSMIWNHSDKLLIDKQTMIYTISGWPEEGRDFSPGYWGEYVEPIYVLENGYYLVGNFSGVDAWSVEDLSAEKKFAENQETEGEYQLAVNFAGNDLVKVVYVENDQIIYWYPKGDNYVVDQNHAGPTTMYFRPNYHEDWAAFGGYFFVVPTGTVDIDNLDANAPAVKVIRNGQLLIIKGEKMYNAQGQIVK